MLHQPKVYQHPIEVRYAETDQMGVVHHANYLVYLEEARAGLLTAGGCPYKELEAAGRGLPVRAVEVHYLRSGRYGDELDVSVAVLVLRPASMRFEQSIKRRSDGALLLTAEVEMACIDMGSRRPTRFPAPLHELLRQALVPGRAPRQPNGPLTGPRR